MIGKNYVHLLTKIIVYTKLMLVCQSFESLVINGAQVIHFFSKFAHFSPIFFFRIEDALGSI